MAPSHGPSGPLDVIDVDWSSLMPKQKQEIRAPGAALLRFTPGAMLLRSGVSRRLAGPQLLARVKDACAKELEDSKGKEVTPMPYGTISTILLDDVGTTC